jgi:hypothetical protein
MRTALCIGGPHDGMVISAEGPSLVVVTRVPLDAAAWLASPDTRASQAVEHKVEQYVYERIISAGVAPVAIWRHSGLPMREALLRVLQVYADEIGVKQQNVE